MFFNVIDKKKIFVPYSFKKFCSYNPFPKVINDKLDGISHLVFYNFSLYRDICKQINKNIRTGLISKEKIILGNKFRKEILSGYYPRIDLKFINNIIGKGVVSLDYIPKGSYVGEYTGIVKKRSRKIMNNNVYCLSYIIHPLKRNYVIDAKEKGNFTRFINHSNHPNLESVSVVLNDILHMVFFSIKDIEPNSQLTFDYGDEFWKSFNKKNIKNI